MGNVGYTINIHTYQDTEVRVSDPGERGRKFVSLSIGNCSIFVDAADIKAFRAKMEKALEGAVELMEQDQPEKFTSTLQK